MYSYPIDELSALQTWSDVWRWCVVESMFLGLIFCLSVGVAVAATGVFLAVRGVLRLVWALFRFVWRLCVMFRTLYVGMFYPKVLLNEIELAIEESKKPSSELQKVLDKVLSEHPAKKKEVLIDLTCDTESEAVLNIRDKVKMEVDLYHMSRAFRDVILSHVAAARDTKSAEEKSFERQEKTREETAWHRLYVDHRASFHKISKKLTKEQRDAEESRIAGFELGFEEGSEVKEAFWTIEQKIYYAKRFVVGVFQSDNLPVEVGCVLDTSEDDASEEYRTDITHINTVVLCGRIYVETIDSWNARKHYDPSDYSSMLSYTMNDSCEHIDNDAWLALQERDRAERRARLSEEAQYAQDLDEAIEADRIVARDAAILMDVRAHRSGKTYAH